MCVFNSHFSRWTWVSQYQNVFILDYTGAQDDGGGDDNWSYKLSPPTNQHQAFYRPDALPVDNDKQQCQSTEGSNTKISTGI